MRIVKGFVFALIGLSIMITLVSLLMPSKVMTVRTVTIHSPAKKVFDQIVDLQNWKHWHPVFMQDSTGVNLSVPSYGVNAFIEWNSNGKKNTLRITEATLASIKARLSREGEKDVENIISVVDLSNSNSVQVEWSVLTKLKWYPWEKFAGIFIDKMTGPGYETALNNLKTFIEGH